MCSTKVQIAAFDMMYHSSAQRSLCFSERNRVLIEDLGNYRSQNKTKAFLGFENL